MCRIPVTCYVLLFVFVVNCFGVTFINPAGPVTFRCLDCICETVSECTDDEVCIEDDACGRYRITPQFWLDAGRPTLNTEDTPADADAFVNCVTNKKCAARTVQQYMGKYKKDCNGDGAIDCKDFFALHLLGAAACNKTLHANFGQRFDLCDQPMKRASAPTKQKNIFLPNFNDHCGKCLCEAATGCNNLTGCDNGLCGLYRISRDYWIDADSPVVVGDDPDRHGAFEECALDGECALQTVKQYLQKFGKDCDGDRITSCTDYMLINFNGRIKCNKPIDRDVRGRHWDRRFKNCIAEDD